MRNSLLFILIFLLGLFLRFYQLGNIPVGFHRDEAFLGYNAYSILKTSHDMTGSFLPIHFQSFLFSPAGYSYFSIPFITLFGLSAFSVRFTSAIFGSFSVLICFFLIRELFIGEKERDYLAAITAFILAISPWHINLSRVATENVIVVFFLTLGIWMFLLSVRKNNKLLLVSAFLSFIIMLITYQAPRAFLPLFLPVLFLFASPRLKSKEVMFTIAGYVMVIIIPVLLILHSPQLSLRIHMLSIFQNPQTQLVLNEQIREDGIAHAPLITTRMFHNKPVGFINEFFTNYFKHFSYEFLFTDAGLPDRYRVPGMGLLYLFDLPLFIFGVWSLLHTRKKIGLFLISWVLLAPVGSALTYDDIPNLQRTLLVFPALAIFIGMGFISLWNYFSSDINRFATRSIIIVCVIFGFLYYLHAYYVHSIYHRPWYREEGFAQLIPAVNKYNIDYHYALITEGESDPAIFFLFYNHTDPKTFQNLYRMHPTSKYGAFTFEKYHFSDLECPFPDTKTFKGDSHVLYVNAGNCKKPKNHVQLLEEIKRKDNTIVFSILRFIP